ncbi:hypothetical protein PSENEW3n2_00002115 [Picochlorum sp. SENEW3]|nr:hypothetical protein PSENEW3n2_00002115 [Picochlorum sp. SENEW3]WPT14885.1 hypothetical protein PSENEW3_00002115 [Picochlorum sp. SENEW3]
MAPTKPAAEGRPKVPPKKIIDTIREATGASDEDIKSVLEECNNDVNEATARLIDNPFSKVVSKKDKRKEREIQIKKEKAAEAKRNYSNRGGRGGGKAGGRGGGRGTGPRKPAEAPKPVQKKEPVVAAPESAAPKTQENGIEPAPIPQPTRTGGTMADLFKKPAPVPEKKQPARPAPQSQRPTNGHTTDQARVPAQAAQPSGAWGKSADVQQEAPRPQPPSVPPTGLATSLMSALGAGNPPKSVQSAQTSLPQETQPSAGQGQLAESEQRGQPGSTSADDVGLNLQFGNFGLGTGNEFGAGFGSTFENQPAQGGAQTQNASRYNEPQAGGGQGKQSQAAFSSFQQSQGDVSVSRNQNADSQQQQQQQHMQHMQQPQYGYSASYGQTAAYWPQQQAPRQQQQAPPQQQQTMKPGKAEAPAPPPQQQQQQQATMMAYGAPGMGAMAGQYATQYPGYQYPYQYAQYPGYYPPQYYAPPQGSQYPPQPPATAQGARTAGGNSFGAGLYDQQDVNYQQPPATGNYQGQPAYNYGQYGR